MAATANVTLNPSLITATDTVDSQLNFDALIQDNGAILSISKLSGTSIKVSSNAAIDAGGTSATIVAADLPVGAAYRMSITKGVNFHYKATAGTETFIVNVIRGTA